MLLCRSGVHSASVPNHWRLQIEVLPVSLSSEDIMSDPNRPFASHLREMRADYDEMMRTAPSKAKGIFAKMRRLYFFFIRYGLYRCPECWKKLQEVGKCNHTGTWRRVDV